MVRGGTRTTTGPGGATWRGGGGGGGGAGAGGGGAFEDIMEGDVLASSQPSTLIDTPTPTHTSRHPLLDTGPSTVRSRPDKQPIIFSCKRGRGLH
jgi:hypothetical protein